MENTLAPRSGILYLKSKFFIIRVVTYFSFLLLPIWIPKTMLVSPAIQAVAISLFILFICSQWFFLGKEIDHRLKIYFRVNSSMDRLVYRVFLGMFFFFIYFNFLSYLPGKWINNAFWTTWAVLGIFYSWPTRGKIIRESMSSNFTEFRYLDSFEKTLVTLILTLFVISIPDLPTINNHEALKLFFDPNEHISPIYWNFLKVNYYPFLKYEELFRLAWSLHFYFVNLGLFLFCFYAFLRFIISRRLSLLGIFALLSSWSWTKLLVADFGVSITTTYSLLWIWSLLWVIRSSTYRTGLFFGLVGMYGVLINKLWVVLWVPHLVLIFYFLNDKTSWFKRQLFRYASFGLSLSLIIVLATTTRNFSLINFDAGYFEQISYIFQRKAFFALAPIGLLLGVMSYKNVNWSLLKNFKLNVEYLRYITVSVVILSLFNLVTGSGIFTGFSLMWIMTTLSLIPLELIFQTMSRLRSSRNMIYLIYILICLLDSHFEGRVKVLLRIFEQW